MTTLFSPLVLLEQGGPIMPLILVAALFGYGLIVERAIIWTRWHWADRPFYQATHLSDLTAALQAMARPTTPLSWLLEFALEQKQEADSSKGETPERALELAVLSRMPAIDARLATIGWLGNILPMLGLLGTVSGMIATFQEMAFSTSRQVLSQGLSEALWTTEIGLLGAVPLLATHHILTRLRARWLNRLELTLALVGSGSGKP